MLAELKSLALDLTWSWEPRIQRLFESLDPSLWEETAHNPIVLLARLGEEGVAERVQDEAVAAALQ